MEGAEIGDNSVIGPNAVVGAGVVVAGAAGVAVTAGLLVPEQGLAETGRGDPVDDEVLGVQRHVQGTIGRPAGRGGRSHKRREPGGRDVVGDPVGRVVEQQGLVRQRVEVDGVDRQLRERVLVESLGYLLPSYPLRHQLLAVFPNQIQRCLTLVEKLLPLLWPPLPLLACSLAE